MDKPTEDRSQLSSDLSGRLMEDQRIQWNRGQQTRVEDYLRQHPRLTDDPQGLLDLIYNEVCLRQDFDESPSKEEYRQRFPQFADELDRLIDVHHAINSHD